MQKKTKHNSSYILNHDKKGLSKLFVNVYCRVPKMLLFNQNKSFEQIQF